jgi:hypothetical protein
MRGWSCPWLLLRGRLQRMVSVCILEMEYAKDGWEGRWAARVSWNCSVEGGRFPKEVLVAEGRFVREV